MSKGKQNTKPSSAKGKSAPTRISQDDYVPKKFGLKYDPPTIILEYLVPSKGKLYHHKMKLNKEHMGPYTLTDEVIEFLRDKHQMYLQHKKIQDNQLEALIERLQNHGKGTKPTTASSSNRPFSASSKGNTFGSTKSNEFDPIKDSKSSSLTKPLGTASSNTTTNSFAATKAPEVSKAPPVTNTAASKAKPAPPKDEEEDYYEEVFEELDFEDDAPPPVKKSTPAAPARTNTTAAPAKKFEVPKYEDQDFEELDEDEVDYNTLNLNKMTPEEVQVHKNKMNSTFSKNVKKPGDIGYEYDKVVEFKAATKESEWDESL